MSETTQRTPSLLERLYYQTQTRAEVYRQRMQLWAADPQTLAQAGQREEAAMAEALKSDPAGGPDRWTECYDADEKMDQAVEMLRRRALANARSAIEHAHKSYWLAGPSRQWDYADTCWNLGCVRSLLGTPGGLRLLRDAFDLLIRQGRLRQGAECGVTYALMLLRNHSAKSAIQALLQADRIASALGIVSLSVHAAWLSGEAAWLLQMPSVALLAFADGYTAELYSEEDCRGILARRGCARGLSRILFLTTRALTGDPPTDVTVMLRKLESLAVTALPREQLETLTLAFQSAIILGVAPETATSGLRRALEALRTRFPSGNA